VLSPDFEADITALPLDQLRARGVRAIAFDLDHTLAHRRTRDVKPAVAAYLRKVESSGFRLLIASNAFADLSPLGRSLGAEVVQASPRSFKPLRGYFRRVIAAAGVPPHQIAMVGDRRFIDLWGAKRAGLVTVKVSRMPE
jgi:HAD superfamily phosphatase (TIGR01668 family)